MPSRAEQEEQEVLMKVCVEEDHEISDGSDILYCQAGSWTSLRNKARVTGWANPDQL